MVLYITILNPLYKGFLYEKDKRSSVMYNSHMNQVRQIKFWSNIFFIIPLAFAISYEVWWYSIVMGIVFIISTLFHFKEEEKGGLEYVDVTSSTGLMLSNLILLFKGHWILPYSVVAIICAVIALTFYARQFKYGYDLNHGIWHIFSAAVSFFSVATFLNFMGLF